MSGVFLLIGGFVLLVAGTMLVGTLLQFIWDALTGEGI